VVNHLLFDVGEFVAGSLFHPDIELGVISEFGHKLTVADHSILVRINSIHDLGDVHITQRHAQTFYYFYEFFFRDQTVIIGVKVFEYAIEWLSALFDE
jgi:hypothetical protein